MSFYKSLKLDLRRMIRMYDFMQTQLCETKSGNEFEYLNSLKSQGKDVENNLNKKCFN